MLAKIVLVNWNRAKDTCDCIDSLERLHEQSWYALVCDNGSKDGSPETLREFLNTRYQESRRDSSSTDSFDIYDYYCKRSDPLLESPRVTLVLSRINLGFAGGNNLALKNSHPDTKVDYVWFLNNDTEVEPGALGHMIDRLSEDRSIGICGATLIYAHDRRTVQALGGAVYSPLFGTVREFGNGSVWPINVDRSAVEAKLSYISGASMLVTSEFLRRVGLMCEDYFLYYEEVDWAERGRDAGFRLGYAPDAVVFHKEGAALGSGVSSKRSRLSEYYGFKNRIVITRKYYSYATFTVYVFSTCQIIRRLTQRQWSKALMMTRVLLGLQRTRPE